MFDRVIKIKVPHKSKYGWEFLDIQKGKYRHIQLPRSGQEFKVEFVGNSRIDGNPMFTLLSTGQISFDSIKSIITHWRFTQAFGELGNEFEPVEKFEDVMAAKTLASDIIPVRPMSLPSGTLYYIDYVYRYNLTEEQMKYLLLSL
jgi:hypothetical protein